MAATRTRSGRLTGWAADSAAVASSVDFTVERMLDSKQVFCDVPASTRRLGGQGDVAQLVEHLLCKQGVVGSSPIVSTTHFPQVMRVLPPEAQQAWIRAA